MHPLCISNENYRKALKINQLQDPQEKALGIKKWEKVTGHKFPWDFPSIQDHLPENWEKVVNQPGLYTKSKLT